MEGLTASVLLAVLMGVIAGILRSVVGFCKNSNEEDFDLGKFLKTVIIAGILGGIIGLFTPDWKLAFALALKNC